MLEQTVVSGLSQTESLERTQLPAETGRLETGALHDEKKRFLVASRAIKVMRRKLAAGSIIYTGGM